MKARILADEPIFGPHIGAKLMKKVIVELREDGWSTTQTFTVSADNPDVTRGEIELAVHNILRDAGKPETFNWAW